MRTPTISRRRDLASSLTIDPDEDDLVEPVDKCHLIRISMFCLGIGSMLAESMMLSIGTYYNKQFPDYEFLVYLVLPVYALPNLLFLLLLTEHGSKIPYNIRVIGAYLIQAVILILMPKHSSFFDLKLMIVCYGLIGINTAIVTSSILGFMNFLDASYQRTTLSGQAFAGILSCVIRIITRYVYSSDLPGLQDSTRVFFYSGAACCFLCAVIFIIVNYSPYVQYKKNMFALSIAGYFRSYKQELDERTDPEPETTTEATWTDGTTEITTDATTAHTGTAEVSVSKKDGTEEKEKQNSKYSTPKHITQRPTTTRPSLNALELNESHRHSSYEEVVNPMDVRHSFSDHYLKMSTSTTKIVSQTKEAKRSKESAPSTEEGIPSDRKSRKTNKNKPRVLKPSEYQKVTQNQRERHLTLAHLAKLQSHKKKASLGLLEKHGQKLYVSDAVLDLLYSANKRKKRTKRRKHRRPKKTDKTVEDVSDINGGVSTVNTLSGQPSSVHRSHRSHRTDRSELSAKSAGTKYSKINLFTMSNKLFPKINQFCGALLLLNLLTWSVFPGLISGRVQSEMSYIAQNHWMSILMATEFYVFNFIGRSVLSSPRFCNCVLCCCQYDRQSYKGYIIVRCCGNRRNMVISARWLTRFCFVRILVIYPLFMLIYVWNIYLWIAHILMALTGLTHGYVYCVTFVSAPQFCAKHHREAAETILRFFHFVGVLLGSCIALGVSFVT